MRKYTVYQFDNDDPNWQAQIEEAFYLLYNFCDRLRDKESNTCKAFNRIANGAAFSILDVNLLCNYAEAVAGKASNKYAEPPFAGTPWADSVLGSAKRLLDVTNRFRQYVMEVA